MADDLPVIADLVADALDLASKEVSDLKAKTPFLSLLPMEESSNGTTHKYAKLTQLPVTGFRDVNAGRDMDHSVDTVVTRTLKIVSWTMSCDVMLAKGWRKGGAAAYLAKEAKRHVLSALLKFETQLWYGTLADAAGFAGLADESGLTATTDEMVVDAGGTTASTGSSVWMVSLGENDMSGVYKGDGPLVEVGDVRQELMDDGTGKKFNAFVVPGDIYLAMQVGSKYSVGRIANLTEDSGKGLTDAKIQALRERFPVGTNPSHIVMNTRSYRQLVDSRTATSPTGNPVVPPTDINGTPIVLVDTISKTEALIA